MHAILSLYSFRAALAAFALLGALLIPVASRGEEPATGAPELPSITFSNIVVRLEGSNTDFSRLTDDFRVLMVETLRAEGFPGVGAESLVFSRDDSATADFALGGTVREYQCKREGKTDDCCRVGVDWELLDVVRESVVYKHRSRYGECHLGTLDEKLKSRRLVIGALRSLLQRERFVSELRTRHELQQEKPYTPAKIASCKPGKIAMAKGGDAALDATVIIESGKGHGSGFLLTPSGLVMTAAHVVTTNEVTVKGRDGVSYRAKPIRISRKFDVALLRAELPEPLPATRCLATHPEQQRTGAEVYAIGAPASQELGFSLTRGIVSGLREREGVHYLQTDTPVSPGNSGGPLVDPKGRAVALVVRKLAGQAMEGIAFGIPIDIALRALALTQAASTDAALEGASPVAITIDQKDAIVDPADAVPAPVRDQGRMFNRGPYDGSNVTKRHDAQQGFDVIQASFYLGASLELRMLAAPKASKERVAVHLVQTWGTDVLEGCSEFRLIVNGRAYPALKSSVTKVKSSGRDRVERVEGQFDLAALRRVREHAPSVEIRGCGKHWMFAPSQIAGLEKLVEGYDALAEK